MSKSPNLATVLDAKPVTSAAANVIVQSHGAELRPFALMLARFGKEAAGDVQLLNRVLTTRTSKLTDAGIAEGWDALTRLAERFRKLPAGREKTLAGLELEQSMLALFSRETDFVVPFVEEVASRAAAARKARRLRALKALGSSTALSPSAAANVLARLAVDLDTAPAALKELWLRFAAAPGADLARLHAAEEAAQMSQKMNRILRSSTLSSADRQAQLWGYVSRIRGLLGEGYALTSPAWLAHLATEMSRARRLAYKLGPGHSVVYLTQMEHGLRLNGPEGPDAVIGIINRTQGIIYDPMRAQVKVASVSEAAAQSGADIVRRVGKERRRELATSWYEFRLDPSGPPEVFVIASRPDVPPSLCLLNAGGARTPAADLVALQTLNISTTEIWFDFTVQQLTHLAISLAESSIKILKTS